MTGSVSRALLRWYDTHRRDLPWRHTRDPYAIWVSEVMLQQTQVDTVRARYVEWLRRYPTVGSLARAADSDVLHAWQGLGYYSRARNLKRGAVTVCDKHGGRIPETAAELRELPGVGQYTAGAIASIAYGERTPVVDGNVIRVLCRLLGLRGDPARAPLKNDLWRRAAELVPRSRPGDFNQSLMELGATVCTPRAPSCASCPVRKRCIALRDGLVDGLPETAKRRATVHVKRAAAIVQRGDRVLTVQVPAHAARWAGMWQFPNADVRARETPEEAARRAVHEAVGLRVTAGAVCHSVRHSVTHHRVTLDVVGCGAPRGTPRARGCAELRWQPVGKLDALAMPSAHRRIATWVASSR